ncbi:Protein of unknown function [Gryllus bimaculatus]|nr:Protein of unknown function [Gryllus bimaculatus]
MQQLRRALSSASLRDQGPDPAFDACSYFVDDICELGKWPRPRAARRGALNISPPRKAIFSNVDDDLVYSEGCRSQRTGEGGLTHLLRSPLFWAAVFWHCIPLDD